MVTGLWQPTGERTATVTAYVFFAIDDRPAEGEVRLTVEVDEAGNALTEEGTVVGLYQDGSVAIAAESPATATRLQIQPVEPLGTPVFPSEEAAHVLLLASDVLTPRQLAFIAERLPEPPHASRGRRPYSNRELLPGILRVLRCGCRWRDLDRPGSPSGVTHWRRLRYWHRQRGYRKVWRTLLNLLVQGKRLDRSLDSLDGTLIPSQEFLEQTGYSGKHRAVGAKLSLLVDRAGIPLAVSVAPGNFHDGA